MAVLTRSDQSIVARWWWTIDRWTLGAIGLLIGFGVLLIQAATPAVAVKHGLDGFYFVERHLLTLVPAMVMIFCLSLLTPRQVRSFAIIGLFFTLPLLVATLFVGVEIKGAARWIQLPGFSIQPSEFVKPFFTLVSGWLFARHCEKRGFPSRNVNIVLFLSIIVCLVGQPDIGMTCLVSLIWFGQFFFAGLPLIFVVAFLLAGGFSLLGAYYVFPHFASRIDRFLSHSGDTYQVDRALDAFMNGGLFGTGPGEGTVKMSIPDAHADFVFAVAGEELGLFWCLLIVSLYLFIIIRSFIRLQDESSLFIVLAASGLLVEFGVQTLINLGSTLHLLPAKGMTLPFISYGGSSLWATAISMGLLLALTRKRYGLNDA